MAIFTLDYFFNLWRSAHCYKHKCVGHYTGLESMCIPVYSWGVLKHQAGRQLAFSDKEDL